MKPSAKKISAIANLTGEFGSRLSSFNQIMATKGAKTMMKIEFKDWNQEAGTSKPSNIRSV